MADGAKIEWTDATWNPITGCSVVSPGCTNCYAMKLAGTRLRHHPSRVGLTRDTKAGPVWTGEVRLNEGWLGEPLRWRRPRKIFVCAHGDLFAEGVPDAWIDRVFAVMALAPQHVFQVLTKRPARMRAYFAQTWQRPAREAVVIDGETRIPARPAGLDDRWHVINCAIDELVGDLGLTRFNRFWTPEGDLIGRPAWPHRPLPNVWLGVSVEDQARANERIPVLLDTPAAVRWISAEPLLGPVDLTRMGAKNKLGLFGDALRRPYPMGGPSRSFGNRLDWVVAGGESGPDARPMHPDWARGLRDQCAAAGVPFLHKQNGAWASVSEVAGDEAHHRFPDGATVRRVGKTAAGRALDGVTHYGFPEARP